MTYVHVLSWHTIFLEIKEQKHKVCINSKQLPEAIYMTQKCHLWITSESKTLGSTKNCYGQDMLVTSMDLRYQSRDT
jgi:hypothetical protein